MPDPSRLRDGVTVPVDNMEETCDWCGFVYDLGPSDRSASAIADGASQMADLIVGATDAAARRVDDTWSPLEYACHLRDVLLVQRERVLLARREDAPLIVPMGRDERADHDGYAAQDRADVAVQLTQAGKLLANVLGRLGPSDWDRTVQYNYPEPAERSLRWLAVHTHHEVTHHLLDVTSQLDP